MVMVAELEDPRGRRVPAVVVEFIDGLSSGMSDPGHDERVGSTMDGVSEAWVSAAEAGRRVGLSGRQVQRLCAAGLVRHRPPQGYTIDPVDLERHLRGA